MKKILLLLVMALTLSLCSCEMRLVDSKNNEESVENIHQANIDLCLKEMSEINKFDNSVYNWDFLNGNTNFECDYMYVIELYGGNDNDTYLCYIKAFCYLRDDDLDIEYIVEEKIPY